MVASFPLRVMFHPGRPRVRYRHRPTGVNCDRGGFSDAYRSWWALNLVAGDRVTIDWQVTPGPTDQEFTEIDLLPVGTNDFNLPNAHFSASTQEFPPGQQMGEFVFYAPASGVMPMESTVVMLIFGGWPKTFVRRTSAV